MRFVALLLLLATPAAAHHEAVVVTALPGVVPVILALSTTCIALWVRLRTRKRQPPPR